MTVLHILGVSMLYTAGVVMGGDGSLAVAFLLAGIGGFITGASR
jgi:hypothetical protein